jgi:hypothetical protein
MSADLTTPATGVDACLPLLVSARRAAKLLSVSERTLWGMTWPRGDLPAIRLPGRGRARSIRYAVGDLEKWIERQRAAQSDPRLHPISVSSITP